MLADVVNLVDPSPEPPADAVLVADPGATDPSAPVAPASSAQPGTTATGDPVTQVAIEL
jgi:hypothetical protein